MDNNRAKITDCPFKPFTPYIWAWAKNVLIPRQKSLYASISKKAAETALKSAAKLALQISRAKQCNCRG